MSELFTGLLKCDDIANSQYENCIVSLGFTYGESFNVTGLSIEKVQILAKNQVIQMTPATLRFLRNNYPEAVSVYIGSSLDNYVSMMNSQLINQSELLMILDWNCSEDAKKKLIDLSPSAISIVERKYSPEISAYILQRKLNSNDLPQLYASYDNQSAQVKDFVFAHSLKNLDSILRGSFKPTTELKCRILGCDQITEYNRQRLLISALKTLSPSDAQLCLSAGKKHEFSKIFNPRAKIKIENNAQCKEILDMFKTRGWIIGYSLNADGTGYDIQRPLSSKKSKRTPVTNT